MSRFALDVVRSLALLPAAHDFAMCRLISLISKGDAFRGDLGECRLRSEPTGEDGSCGRCPNASLCESMYSGIEAIRSGIGE
ncbi:hypothetical protein I547_4734 [Mycobacterium kansasii 824]|uniref:Uncharacterized protein n=1 Tax=Mycobacterium kansasii TaxID=1768 RepID=A0A1V3X0M4_MYCKA|nr:hypothetical protein I547_4734 [Mycobacterium kansasii 824]OOK72376.1 hypothetical protein BZL30_5677 [Mycobacterium kansasii]